VGNRSQVRQETAPVRQGQRLVSGQAEPAAADDALFGGHVDEQQRPPGEVATLVASGHRSGTTTERTVTSRTTSPVMLRV
jgi:hypothetical protein